MEKGYSEWDDESNVTNWLASLAPDEAQEVLQSVVTAMPFTVHLLLLEHSLRGELQLETPNLTNSGGGETWQKPPMPVTLQLVRGGLHSRRRPRRTKEHGPFYKGDD